MQDNNEPGPASPSNLPAAQSTERVQALALAHSQAMTVRMGGQDDDEDGEGIDLRKYWQMLVKRKWTVLGATAIVFLFSLVGTLLTTPTYRATISIQIDRENLTVVETTEVSATDTSSGEYYQTQYELLRSRILAERVASQMQLASQPGLLERMSPTSPMEKVLSVLNRGDDGSEAEALTESEIDERQAWAVGFVRGGLSIQPGANSRVVRLHFDSPDPKISQAVVNAFADAYIAQNLERRFDSNNYAATYLEDRLQELKQKLEDSERKLVEFAQKEQLVDTGGTTGTLSEQNLSSLNAALAVARQERIKAESRWRQAQATRGTVVLGEVSENSIIKSLQESRSKLMAEYQDKLRLYKPAYPLMQQLKGQIDEVDKQIASEIGSIKSAVQAEYLAAKEQEALLAEQMSGFKTEVLDLQTRSIQYNIFKREVDTNRQLYDGLLQRYKEIGVAAGVSSNNISVVDRAEPGYRFKPDLRRNLMQGLLFGLLLGVLLALGFEYLDDTLKNPDDIEKRLGLSVLGIIPYLKAPLTPVAALEDPRSAFSEAYRSVRTALQFSTDAGVPRCLLVTSATPSEGKSTTALVLARNFAQLGKRVLVVDGDLRNPSLHRSMGVENTAGLSNYLAGAAKATEVIQATDVPGLMFMPTGPLPPNPAELLMGPKMLSLLSIAGEKFDQVIIDGPPIMGLADAPILANMATGTLLVVEAGETRIGVARNALKRLVSARAHVVGALLTKFQAKHTGYGYNYGYGDYNYYSYGSKDTPKKLARG